METNNYHREVIDCWPTRAALGRELKVPGWMVRQWAYRGRIPSAYWMKMVGLGITHGYDVSLERLAGAVQAA